MFQRAALLLTACLALTATGCASRDAVAARQTPQPLATQMVKVDASNPYHQQMALGPITGASQFSWFLPEPNRSVLRPRFERALQSADLAAPNRDQARFVISMHFTEEEAADFGSHMESALIGSLWIEDRLTGRTVLNEPIHVRKEAYWPGVTEADWADGGYLGVLNLIPFFFDSPWMSVGARWDTTYPAYSGPEWAPLVPVRLRQVDTRLMVAPNGQAFGAWSGADRAWQVNALVSDAVAAAMMRAMADRNMIDLVRVLPCGGGAQMRSYERTLMARGERVSRPACDSVYDDLPLGAEALRR